LIRHEIAKAVLMFSGVALIAFLAVCRLSPPEAAPETSPATEFSAGRAAKFLMEIAQKPHPMGAPEHARVRDYIFRALSDMGFKPEAHDNSVIRNIVVRLNEAGEGRKAVVLVAHYDTVQSSPGAGDDGYGVATLLETARALKANAPLKNKVILLFTDGEERGLLGAKAFVYGHPSIADAGIVLNFDARGNSGPFLMFQTSDQNEWLIEEFGKAAPFPVANSLMSEIYKTLPNDTDFSVFIDAGVAGLNFACIDGFGSYHTPADSLDNIDSRTIQHAGSYALALTRHFGELDLDRGAGGRVVYFDILGKILVRYSQKWILPLTIFVALLLAGIFTYGFLNGRLTLTGIAMGFLALLLSILGSIAVIYAAQPLGVLAPLAPDASAHNRNYGNSLYVLGPVALTLVTTLGVYALFRKIAGVQDLTAGGLLWWLLLMTLSSLITPGGSYLFTWPLLFNVIAFGLSLTAKNQKTFSWKHSALFSICAIPGGILLTPMVYLVLIGMTLKWSAALMAVVVLLLGTFIPHLCQLVSPGNRQA
jgi:hypothetical protein